MILTTTNSIEGHPIIDYLGIVSGISVNSHKVSLSFSMKKYYNSLAEDIKAYKEEAFQELKQHAQILNANAVVGISVDIEVLTTGGVTVSVVGTAVKVKI